MELLGLAALALFIWIFSRAPVRCLGVVGGFVGFFVGAWVAFGLVDPSGSDWVRLFLVGGVVGLLVGLVPYAIVRKVLARKTDDRLHDSDRSLVEAWMSTSKTLRARMVLYEVNSKTVFSDDIPAEELDKDIEPLEWDLFLTEQTLTPAKTPLTFEERWAHWGGDAVTPASLPLAGPPLPKEGDTPGTEDESLIERCLTCDTPRPDPATARCPNCGGDRFRVPATTVRVPAMAQAYDDSPPDESLPVAVDLEGAARWNERFVHTAATSAGAIPKQLVARHYWIALFLVWAVVMAALGAFLVRPAFLPDPTLTFVEALKDGVGGVDGLDGAFSVTVSPDGSHVYAAAFVDDAVTVFSRNGTTGALTFVEALKDGVGGVVGLDGARSVTVSPDGRHVYVAAQSDDTLTVFSRNSTRGALTFVEVLKDGVGGVDGLHGAHSVTVSPDGRHVYVAAPSDNAVAVFSRNSTTGALTFVEALKDGLGGVDGLDRASSVTVSPDGSHVYTTAPIDESVAVFSRNGTTGALTFVEALKDGRGVNGLFGAHSVTVSPDGSHVYTAALIDDSVAVFSRNSTTGALTFVKVLKDGAGGVDGLAITTAVTVSPDGSHLYTAAIGDDAVAVFRIGK